MNGLLAVVADRRRRLVDAAKPALWEMATRRAAVRGFAVMRVGFSLVLIILLVGNAGGVSRLWTPDAPFSHDLARAYLRQARSFSVFTLSAVPMWTIGMLVLTGAVAVAFGLGWRTRVMAPLLAVLVFSLQERNPFITDGGDNLMRILLIYLVLADTGACWSLDARRRARRPANSESIRWQLGTLLHNAALVLVIFQIIVVYEVAGLAKVRGSLWQNGTAIYYVLRDAQFSPWPELSRLVWQSSLVVNALTWGTVLFQVSFPLLMLRTLSRRLALAAAFGLHSGIGLLMGLPLFSATMLLAEAVLVTNREWERIADLVLRWRATRASPRPAADGRPLGQTASAAAPSS